MVFSSTTFLFVFLPIFLLAYLYLPKKNAIALCFSLLFYTWGEGVYLLLLLSTILLNFIAGKCICQSEGSAKKFHLFWGVAANLLILGYFKYFGFLVEQVLGLSSNDTYIPLLPLGISFYIFQSISYLVDVYRKDSRAADSIADLALYISMFPQLVAGPIVRYATVSEAIRERTVDVEDVKVGGFLFLAGLTQKVLIANNVAEIADAVYALPLAQIDTTVAWLGATAYTIQIYFDFAGYSLMAIGIGRIMGFHFPQNFNYPYISKSVTEFWRRWHMSLSSWFRDYLYIPLGGNRKGPYRTYFNLLIVFFLCGLWHGASWTFVAWGMFHGGILIIERMFLSRWLDKWLAAFAHAYTLLLVMIGWVLFRADTFEQASTVLAAMAGFGAQEAYNFYELLSNENIFFMLLGVIFSAPLFPWLSAKLKSGYPDIVSNNVFIKVAYAGNLLIFLCCSVYIMSGTYNPFIYFRF